MKGSTVAITKTARTEFAPEQVRLMRDTVAKDCTEPEFHFFLEVCARYEFNPFLGEIYAAKMRGKNGSPGRVAIIVGRNGWVKEANRQPDFRGLDSDVVRENDVFRMVRTPDGRRSIHHEYEITGEKGRGKVIGAWAEIRFKSDRAPVYTYLPVEEYKPSNLDYTPWGKQESVMMEKCAIVAALRTAFPIGGVYDEAEMSHLVASGEADVEAVAEEIEWGDDEAMAKYLQDLAIEANRVQPGSWLPERLRLKLQDADDDAREVVAAEMAALINAKGGKVPERVMDAEVVAP